MPKQTLSLDDKIAIQKLMIAAPYSYACSSLWYGIADKYGISIYAPDDERFKFYKNQGIIGNAETL
jgi:hypothetical protein